MKFTHKQSVTCDIGSIKITDAKISINSDGTPFICHNESTLVGSYACADKLGYKVAWVLNKDFTDAWVTNLKPVEKNWDTIAVGDILVDKDGDERKVLDLGKYENIVFLSSYGYADNGICSPAYSKEELIKMGYTIKQPKGEEQPLEVSMDEVAEKFGVDVSKLKIKKD